WRARMRTARRARSTCARRSASMRATSRPSAGCVRSRSASRPRPPYSGAMDAARRRLVALALAALLAALADAFPLPGATEEARRLTAVMAVVGALWVTEALPLAATALLGPAAAGALGGAPAKRGFAAL